MIPVDQAVNAAVNYFESLWSSQPPHAIRVEEVEVSDDGKGWVITLGFLEDGASLATAIGMPSKREYKQFRVNGSTGDVEWMRMRIVG